MILMLTADENWNIGLKGKMLVDLEKDLTRFREKTTGNIVIMGRKTLEAIPGGQALPDRVNLVMTRDKDFRQEGIIPINSIDELFETIEELNEDKEREVFVTGGESIVRQLLKYCTKAYVTRILVSFPDHDTSIPNLDKLGQWERVWEGEKIRQEDIEYKYVNYVRVKKD